MATTPSQDRSVVVPAVGTARRCGWLPRVAGRAEAVALVALIALVVALLPPFAPRPRTAQAAVPAGFGDTLVASIGVPTAIAFTPDGRMLVTTQGGLLKVVKGFQTPGAAVTVSDAVNLSGRICANSERGLLGVAVDPNFASNRFIYLFYTFNKFGSCGSNTSSAPVNRVSRFTMSGDTVSTSSEVVLIDNMPSPNGNHNAGDVNFGPDGLLYVSIGDGGCDYAGNSGCAGANDAARDPHVLTGKILRITAGGGIPAGNPYPGGDRCNVNGRTTAGRQCQETFASGLRNPFRFAFDPNGGNRFFINDVGQGAWEEIDNGVAGADYGWNVREGFCANGSTTNCGPTSFTNPIHAYGRSAGCASITGGAFVPNGVWPSGYDGSYLFADYVCGKIFRRSSTGAVTDFATGLGSSSAVHLEFGPYNGTHALYYTTYAAGGQIRRIAATGQANRPPVAAGTATPPFGALPLTVQFDGRSSSDPDADPLTYSWNFGDNTPNGTGAQVSHTYSTKAVFTATLTVSDGRGGTDTETFRIDAGNTQPTPVISSPTASALFTVGQTVTLTGSANDAEDGTLPNTALKWEVLRHHDTHTHPWVLPTTGNNITFQAPPPEDLTATNNSYLEIRLTATDSTGLSKTITQNFQPKKVNLTFQTNPTGRTVVINETSFVTPVTITSWQGYVLNVEAPVQFDASGQLIQCTGWSDGGACSHSITTPANATTYTATFGPSTSPNSGPLADARVQEANPTSNFGTSTALRAEGGSDPEIDTYLRFQVTGVSGTVTRATLWLHAYDGSTNGPAIYGTSNTWDERTITWNNRPAPTTGVLDDLGNIPINSWATYDVTGYVTGNGTFSFVLDSSSTDNVSFRSKEYTTNRPRLVVETGAPADTQPPTAPTNLTATAATGGTLRIDLGWTAATDNVGVTNYQIERNGVVLATVGNVTTYQDTTVAAGTTYTYRVRARDAANNLSAWSSSAQATTPGGGTSTGFVAVADSRVYEGAPTTNYGTGTTLKAEGASDPDTESYLKFTVSGLTGSVTSAKIRVYVLDGSTNGPAVYTAGNTWTETGITWNNRPARGTTARDNKGSVAVGTWVEFDVTPWVTGNGTFTFVLAADSNDSLVVGARNHTNKPQLVVVTGTAAADLGAADAATPTAAPETETPTPTPTPDPSTAGPTPTPAVWTPFADGFESGDLAAWEAATGLTVEFDQERGSLVARARRAGSETGVAATGTSAQRTLAPAQPELYLRVSFRQGSRLLEPVTLLSVQNEAGATVYSLALDRDGALLLTDAAGNVTRSWVRGRERGWQEFQVRLRTDPAGGPGLIEVWFDGRLVHRAPAVLGTARLSGLVLGDAAFVPGRAYDLAFDDVAADVRCIGTCPGELVTPTPEPTATEPATATPTNTPEAIPTDTPAPEPSPTAEPPTPEPPTPTTEPLPTDTPVPPPTDTPVPPSAEPTTTPEPASA